MSKELYCEDCNIGGTGQQSPYYKIRYGVCDSCSGLGVVVIDDEDGEEDE